MCPTYCLYNSVYNSQTNQQEMATNTQVAVYYDVTVKRIYVTLCKAGEEGNVDRDEWYEEEQWEDAMEDACSMDDRLKTELGVVNYHFPEHIPVQDVSNRTVHVLKEERQRLLAETEELEKKLVVAREGVSMDKRIAEGLTDLLQRAKQADIKQRKSMVRDGIHAMASEGLFTGENRKVLDNLKAKYDLVY